MKRLRYNVDFADPDSPRTLVTDDAAPADVLSSEATDGLHYPVLDIDMPCRLVESSTPGHYHLYIDTLGVPWEKYATMLIAMGHAGVLEHGYVHHSLKRRATFVRAPGVIKDPSAPGYEPAGPIPEPQGEEGDSFVTVYYTTTDATGNEYATYNEAMAKGHMADPENFAGVQHVCPHKQTVRFYPYQSF